MNNSEEVCFSRSTLLHGVNQLEWQAVNSSNAHLLALYNVKLALIFLQTRNPFPTTAVTTHCDGYHVRKRARFPPDSRFHTFEVSVWRCQENTERVPAMDRDRFRQIISSSSFTSHPDIDTVRTVCNNESVTN
jgi:hypothetical protein